VRWKLADLRRGSPAILTWAGEPRRRRTRKDQALPYDLSPIIGEAVISGMEKLERGEGRPREFSDDALDATARLAYLRRPRGITSVAIMGENSERTKERKTLALTERVAAAVNDIIGPKHSAIGSVEGTLQAIHSHGELYFAIYDSVWGSRVKCDIPQELKPKALAAFDQRVIVRGIVSTDAAGHPRHVKVQEIQELPKRDQLPQSLRGIDADYTAGLDVSTYVKKRWAGDA